MAIKVESQRRPLPVAASYEPMSSYPGARLFTNPWMPSSCAATDAGTASAAAAAAAAACAPGSIYSGLPSSHSAGQSQTHHSNHTASSFFPYGLGALAKLPASSAGGVSMAYAAMPITTSVGPTSSGAMPAASYGASQLLGLSSELVNSLPPPMTHDQPSYPADISFSTAPSPRSQAHPSLPASAPYDPASATATAAAAAALAYSTSQATYASQPTVSSLPPPAPPPPPSPAQQLQQAQVMPAPMNGVDRQWSQHMVSSAPANSTPYLTHPADVSARSRQASLADPNRSVAPSPAEASPASHDEYDDVMAASRSLAMLDEGDDNITPRNIYDIQSREPTDSYGFPIPRSSSSSATSGSSPYAYYGSGSVDSSASGYSSTSETFEPPLPPRPLARAATAVSAAAAMSSPSAAGAGGLPPAPQTMMGQFNSKVSSSAQKKHRCKICDKRFTRPSSLRTHMFSHTGEKPYPCEVSGCGRHFSVVSNLRRHRKVHRDRDLSSGEE